MKKYEDGWHEIRGFDVWVEDGHIIRGMKPDINGSYVAVYPFKKNRSGNGWDRGEPTVEAFLRGPWNLF